MFLCWTVSVSGRWCGAAPARVYPGEIRDHVRGPITVFLVGTEYSSRSGLAIPTVNCFDRTSVDGSCAIGAKPV